MPTPKGNLVVPIGFDDDGNLLAFPTLSDGTLKIYVAGGSLNLTTHNLLDGSVHPDTIAASPVEGDLIVGIDQGGGQIRWQRQARGTTGQVLTVKSDGSLEWAAASGGGAVVQTATNEYTDVATGTTTIPADNTIPQNTEGTEFMTVTITPTDAANTLLVIVEIQASYSVVAEMVAALFRDSGADALCATSVTIRGANDLHKLALSKAVVAGSTSATTFKVRAGAPSAGTFTMNGSSGTRRFGGVASSCIRVLELAG